jgi:cytochrome c553
MYISRLFFIGFLFLSACEPKSKQTIEPSSQTAAFISTHCGSCHGLGLTEQASAPNLMQVKKSWKQAYPEKQAFIDQMASFLLQPEAQKSRMDGAVKTYGLMPKMGYDPQQAKEIAAWLYTHEPVESNAATQTMEESPLEKGRSIALATKAALGKQLMRKLKEEGPVAAIDFCQLKALPITDSVSKTKGAEVRRITDKARNLKNACTEEEFALLQSWKTDLELGKQPEAVWADGGDHILGYYPIITEEKCLVCHGQPSREVQQILQKRYPADLALGYDVGQIRGAFRVRMSK